MGVIAALLLAAASAGDATGEIRALRAQSNAAIAAHDAAALAAVNAPDYALLPGSLGVPLRGEDVSRRLAVAFEDPTFITYVRTPGQVSISSSGKRAAETGTWVGTWRKPDGEMRLSGVYQAMWLPTPAGWRLKNESFVTLHCTGSRACAGVD